MKRFLFSLFCIALALFSLGFALLQTTWARSKITEAIVNAAKDQGIDLKLNTLGGRPPFTWVIPELQFQDHKGNVLTLESCKARIAFFPLFRKEVVISHLRVSKAIYRFTPNQSQSLAIPQSLPKITASIKHLQVDILDLQNGATKETLSCSMNGKGRLKMKSRDLYLNIRVQFINTPSDFIELLATTDRSREELSIALKAQLENSRFLSPIIKLPFDTNTELRLIAKGPWETWSSIAHGDGQKKGLPLICKLQSEILRLDIEQVKEVDRKWKIESNGLLYPDQTIAIQHISAHSDIGSIEGSASIKNLSELESASLRLILPDLAAFNAYTPFPVQGTLNGNVLFEQGSLKILVQGKQLSLLNQRFPSFEMNIEGQDWQGHVTVSVDHPDLPLKGEGTVTWNKEETLSIDALSIEGPDTSISGTMSYNMFHKGFSGCLSMRLNQLARFSSWVPSYGLEGSLSSEIIFDHPEDQMISLSAQLDSARLFRAYAEKGSIEINLNHAWTIPEGSISISIDKGIYKEADIEHLHFNTVYQNGKWKFDAASHGIWQDPYATIISGYWNYKNGQLDLTCNEWEAELRQRTLVLDAPFQLSACPKSFRISETAFILDCGECRFSCDFNSFKSEAKLEAEHFPLDLICISQPGLSIQGSASMKGNLSATTDNITGSLSCFLESTQIFQFGKQEPTQTKGFLQAHLDHGHLQLHVSTIAKGDELLDCTANLSLLHQLYPFSIHVDPSRPCSGELVVEGRLEEMFDFINLGSHKLGGNLICHLLFSQTPENPALNGTITITDGTYENYYTGTTIKNLNLSAKALKNEIIIQRLSGTDGKEGSLSATGSILLNPKDHFPYTLDAQLKALNAIHFDMISSDLTGALKITGTSESALASGTLDVPHTTFQISDKMLIDIPVLPVTFVHQPAHLEEYELNPPSLFPFHLDLYLRAKENVLVSGRGLTAELGGALHVTGTNAAIKAQGALSLIKGKYEFSGKTFTLTEGEISFSDQPHHQTHLNIKGSLNLQDKTIIAILSGPLVSPALTFQSLPALPTSSILALILFNKDITEIHRMEALQLAQTLMTLSGNAGPGIIEKIRKTIGVDKLTIVSNPSNEGEISLQIGKYLMQGLMVTLSQGPTSSQIIVEVELKHGFILSAETQQEDGEQGGKFSLKWNKNY